MLFADTVYEKHSMTMPRKSSRTVQFGGHTYRYMVRSEGSNLRVTFEHTEHPSRVCVALFGSHIMESVGPKNAIGLIRLALRLGWAPAVSKAQFSLGEQAILDHWDEVEVSSLDA